MRNAPSPIPEGLTSCWTDRAHSYSEQDLEEMNDGRPERDRETLARLGMANIETVPEACRGVLDEVPWEHQLPNPMFMVSTEKEA